MMWKKIIPAIALHLFLSVYVWAGDVATFVDLGFSPDGRIYMFGQHGVLLPSLRPWADLFIVDVAANNFVPNGRISHTQNNPINAGQDGSGVLFQLMSQNAAFASRHGVNYKNQGLPLYITRAEFPETNINFRDFISGRHYTAQIISNVEGSGRNIRSSFYINMQTRMPNGQTRNYTIGTPHLRRQGIASYNFNKVLIDPRGESIIFVIEMRRVADNGYDIRYMIEAARL